METWRSEIWIEFTELLLSCTPSAPGQGKTTAWLALAKLAYAGVLCVGDAPRMFFGFFLAIIDVFVFLKHNF